MLALFGVRLSLCEWRGVGKPAAVGVFAVGCGFPWTEAERGKEEGESKDTFFSEQDSWLRSSLHRQLSLRRPAAAGEGGILVTCFHPH